MDLLRDCAGMSEQKLGSHHLTTIRRYERLREWEAEDGLEDVAQDGNETGTDIERR